MARSITEKEYTQKGMAPSSSGGGKNKYSQEGSNPLLSMPPADRRRGQRNDAMHRPRRDKNAEAFLNGDFEPEDAVSEKVSSGREKQKVQTQMKRVRRQKGSRNRAGSGLPLFTVLKLVCTAVLLILILRQFGGMRMSSTPFETVRDDVLAAADLTPMQEGDNQMLRRLYGLDPSEYEGCLLYYPATSMGAEELLVLRLRGREQQETAAAAVQARKEEQMGVFEGYAVEPYEMLEKSVIEIRGNYILFVSAADPEAVRKAFLHDI